MSCEQNQRQRERLEVLQSTPETDTETIELFDSVSFIETTFYSG